MANPARFQYTSLIDSSGARLIRPLVPVLLTNNRNQIRTTALIDSGADANVLPYQLGLDLNADWNSARAVPALSGNLGQTEARAVALDVAIAAFDPVKMILIWVKTDAARLLFGQINFFQRFDVCFSGIDDYIDIQLRF
jgi:hypothetical protein